MAEQQSSAEQTPEPQAQGPIAEKGSEAEALNALMEREKAPLKQAEATETPADEPDSEDDEEAAQGEPDESDEKGELVEVEYGGEKLKVKPETAAELEKATLRQADYSRKMNEVGAAEKTAKAQEELATHLVQGAEKFAAVLAKINGIDTQLQTFAKVDWENLERTDPTAFAATAAKFQLLQMGRDRAVSEAQSADAAIRGDQAKLIETKRVAMLETVSKSIKGWGDEAGMAITKYAVEKAGFSVADIQSLTDARIVIALDKARKFDAIQDGKAALKDKVKDLPPVNKPGSPRVVNKSDGALAKFKTSRSEDDGVAALMARFRS